MCFSAEVSFAASAGLSVVGVKTILSSNTKTRLVSVIPIVFALHQFAEGMNWFLFSSNSDSFWKPFFTQLYAYIEYTFWPFFIPLAVFWIEPIQNTKRRKIQLASFFIGLGYSLFWITYMLQGKIWIHQFCNPGCGGLAYIVNFPPFTKVFKLTYLFLITVPALSCSYRSIKFYGGMTGVAWVFSNEYFIKSFGSTWCFFAAILSITLLWTIKEQKGYNPQEALTYED